MRTLMRRLLAASALVALTGCASIEGFDVYPMATGMTKSSGSTSNLTSPVGGGGHNETGDLTGSSGMGSIRALLPSALGPLAWTTQALWKLRAAGPQRLWTAPDAAHSGAIALLDESTGWAVGHGVAHYQPSTSSWVADGTDIDPLLAEGATRSVAVQLLGVAVASGSTPVGFAVGTRGTVLRYDAASRRWRRETLPAQASTARFGSVTIVGPDDVWVAGTQVLHYAQGTWTVTSLPAGISSVSGLSVVSDHNLWASAGTSLLHWTGGETWSVGFTPDAPHSVGTPQIATFGSQLLGVAMEEGVPGGWIYALNAAGTAWNVDPLTVPDGAAADSVVLADAHTAYARDVANDGLYRVDLVTRTVTPYGR